MSQKIKKKFIADEIFTDISSEIESGDSTLQGNIDTEEAARIAGDASLQSQIDDEKDENVVDSLAYKIAQLDGEYTTDAELSAAVSALQTSIDAVQADVDQNELDADTAIAAVQADVDQNEADGDADRALIRSEFAAADSALDAAYKAADQSVRDDFAAADSALQSQIDFITSNTDPAAIDSLTEVVAEFQNADGNLQTSITNLSTAAADDRALIRSEFAAADSALLSQIESNDVDIAANATAISAEEARALAAEADLQSQITDINNNTDVQEELDATQVGAGLEADGSYSANASMSYVQAASSLKDADEKLDAGLAAEKARAEGEEVAIRQDFAAADSALDAAYKAADDGLQGNIDAEVARATTAEGNLQSSIDANSSAISDEVARATAAEGVNAAAIAAEQSRAEGVEGSLQSQIDFITSNTDPAAIDSLTEVVAEFQNADGNLQTSITNLSTAAADDRALIRSEFAAADSALDAAYKAADSALDTRVTTLEGQVADLEAVNVVWIKEKFVLGTDANEVDGVWSVALSNEPVSGSESVFVGRLAMHDEDYSMSGQQVSFDGAALVDGGDQDLVAGDVIYVKYQYQA